MSWERFEQPTTGKTEIWFRFLGGNAGDWERPCGRRIKSLHEVEKIGWRRVGPCQPPGMAAEGEACEGRRATPDEPSKKARDGNIAKSVDRPL